MAQMLIVIDDLPDSPLEAARHFHGEWAARIMDRAAQQSVAVLLPKTSHEHRAWRVAAARDLARHAAPNRVNFIAGAAGQSADDTAAYLAQAKGVTGQYFILEGDI